MIYFGQSGVAGAWSVLRVLQPAGVGSSSVSALGFNPVGSKPWLLAVGHADGEIAVWDLEKTQPPHKANSRTPWWPPALGWV